MPNAPTFHPDSPPAIRDPDMRNLAMWTLNQLELVSQAITQMPSQQPPIFGSPPAKPRNGQMVYADGTNWNPGFGDGNYTFTNGGWVPAFFKPSMEPDENIGIANCGRLRRDSATQISLVPYKGNSIKIAGVNYSIPATGIITSNGSLGASTLYYVYVYNSGGTPTLVISTTGHVPDTTTGNVGTEIELSDNTRSLVGMVYTNVSSQFQDDTSIRGVLSWFNRQRKKFSLSFGNLSTSATTATLLGSAQGTVLNWVDGLIEAFMFEQATTNDAGAAQFFIGADGTTQFGIKQIVQAAATYFPVVCGGFEALSEGAHVLRPVGLTGTGGLLTLNNVIITGSVEG